MSNEDEIRDITEKLQSLQIEQTALIARLAREQATLIDRLARVTEDSRNRQATQATTTRLSRTLQIGDRVRIRNPGPFQATTGKIEKISDSRVTVRTETGSKILRAHKNIILINQQE